MKPSPIQVRQQDGRPVAVRWSGRVHPVEQVVDTWILQGRWWTGEEHRTYYRLLLQTGATLDVYHNATGWYLEAIVGR